MVSPVASVIEKPAPKTVLIESYGDSTTKGQGASDPSQSEPAQLQTMLQAKFGPTVTVSNLGVSSTEASQLLNGTDSVHPTWAAQMAASKAQIVTLNFGLNDAFFTVSLRDGAPPETPQQYAQIMTQLAQIAREAGKTVVLYEPHPVCEPIRQPLLPSYIAALNQVAQATGAPIVHEYDYLASLPKWPSMLTDCLHPSDAGYQVKANLEFPVLAPIVSTAMAG